MAQYDNTCKILVEEFTADIVEWLLGEAVEGVTTLEATELLVDPVYTDSLILLEAEDLILHLEFQVTPKPELPFRMLDYRVRGHRRYPQKVMRQVVIYLRPSGSPLVYQDTFELENSFHRFQVLRLWEQPTEVFLNTPGLLPFAVLSQTEDPVATLQQVSERLQAFPLEDALEQNLTASTTILAGLLLDPDLIRSILRRDTMRESSVYQAILAEGRQEGRQDGLNEGRQEGRQEGLKEEARKLVLRMLRRRLKLLPSEAIALQPTNTEDSSSVMPRELELRLERLSLLQLEELGEALLEFEVVADLMNWLADHEPQ